MSGAIELSMSVLQVVGVAAAGLWLAVTVLGMVFVRLTPRIEDRTPPGPAAWPKLSVVLAACNEADTLEPALTTLLQASYPALEIVVVNDRSTDETGAILERLAATDERIVPVHVTELPAGWLGKVHALERGVERASGELLLFTDADIHFAPGGLERAVGVLIEDELDHLSLLPNLIGGTFPLRVCISAFASSLVLSAKLVLERRDDMALGVGAFNLCRREALERAGGFEDLRMEVVDDTGLAVILVRAGAKSACLGGTRTISVAWYPSARAMMHGIEKNVFALIGGYRMWRLVPTALLLAALPLAPVLAFLPGPVPYGAALLGVAFAGQVLAAAVSAARFGFSFPAGVLAPLGNIFVAVAALRGGVLCERRGGIVWRGTHYPLDALRAGQIVRL